MENARKEEVDRTKKSRELLEAFPENVHKKFLVSQQPQNFAVAPKGTFRVPTSSVLNRVKNFLPELINANDKLSKITDAERCELDIENTNNSEKIIEMNISLVNNELLVSDVDDEESSEEESDNENNETNYTKKKISSPQLIEEISKTDIVKT